jgi:hypothetical protein
MVFDSVNVAEAVCVRLIETEKASTFQPSNRPNPNSLNARTSAFPSQTSKNHPGRKPP